MNPYLAGTMLGIVLLMAMFLAGRGLGASGGLKYCVVSIVGAVDRPHADNSLYYSKYFEDGKKPLKNWLTIEILGVVAGGFLSGALSKRLRFKIEKSPKITNVTVDLCFSWRRLFRIWCPTCQRLHERCRSVGNGSSFCGRIRDYGRDIRFSIYVCMVLQEKLDIKWDQYHHL